MMSRIESILNFIRVSLSDLSSDRWSDEQLLTYIDRAQKILVDESGFLKTVYNLEVIPNRYMYTLPDTVLRVTRVEFNRTKLIPVTINEQPNFGLATGEPIQWLKNKLQVNQIAIYPTPDDSYTGTLSIFATETSNTITSIDDELQISRSFDRAIEFYSCYLALIVNQDTVSVQLAQIYYNNYVEELKRLLRDTSVNFNSYGSGTIYQGFI